MFDAISTGKCWVRVRRHSGEYRSTLNGEVRRGFTGRVTFEKGLKEVRVGATPSLPITGESTQRP